VLPEVPPPPDELPPPEEELPLPEEVVPPPADDPPPPQALKADAQRTITASSIPEKTRLLFFMTTTL
jgi:hypothetical protein